MADLAQPLHPEQAPGGPWSIAELARRAGFSVDTVRFYRREGLLPPDRGGGRRPQYGPEHLRRLAQVRMLRRRRLGVTAIRELAATGLLDLLSAPIDSGDGLDADALAAASGLAEAQVRRLWRDAVVGRGGPPPRPGAPAGPVFDGWDVAVAAAVRALEADGLAPEPAARVARLYRSMTDALAVRLAAELGALAPGRDGGGAPSLGPELTALLDALHRRSIERPPPADERPPVPRSA